MDNEEKKLKEIEFQEKRVAARNKIASFRKKQRFVPYITAACGAAFFILAWHFARVFYDLRMPILSGVCFLAFILLTCAVNVIAGGIALRSIPQYVKKKLLMKKWQSAAAEMEKIEEKAIQQTAYEGDISKTEIRLMKISKEVIEKM